MEPASFTESDGVPILAVPCLKHVAPLCATKCYKFQLHVLTLAYYGVSVRTLPKRGSIKEQQQQIFSQYVQQMVAEQSSALTISPEQMRHHLTWIAQQMQQHNQTIFYLEQLQPDWLPAGRLRKLYEIFANRIPGAFIGALASLLVASILYGGFSHGFWFGLIGGLVGWLMSGNALITFKFSHLIGNQSQESKD